MVSELIQYLQTSVQTSVFNLPKSLSFPRKKVSAKHFSINYQDKNLRLEHISAEDRRDKLFGQFDCFRNFPIQRSEHHCRSRISLTFQATAQFAALLIRRVKSNLFAWFVKH